MIEESLDEIACTITNKELSKKTRKDLLGKDFLALVLRPVLQFRILGEVFKVAVQFLMFSIGLAFCLFGFTANPFGFSLGWILFYIIYVTATMFFIIGTFILVNGIFTFLDIGTRPLLKGTHELIVERLKKRVNDLKQKVDSEG